MSLTRKKTKVPKVLPAPPKGKEDRHFVTALSRGLEVLGCFRSGDKLLGNVDIARRCGLPKSTVSRLTYTLTRIGYLHYDETSASTASARRRWHSAARCWRASMCASWRDR